MGNIEKPSLSERMAKRRERAKELADTKNMTIPNMAKRKKTKDLLISSRVNGNTYTQFKKACEARGLSPNACINMMMTDFVIQNKHLIDD